jgi:hypothetical protein
LTCGDVGPFEVNHPESPQCVDAALPTEFIGDAKNLGEVGSVAGDDLRVYSGGLAVDAKIAGEIVQAITKSSRIVIDYSRLQRA